MFSVFRVSVKLVEFWEPGVWDLLGFLGWGSLYKHRRINLGIKILRMAQSNIQTYVAARL